MTPKQSACLTPAERKVLDSVILLTRAGVAPSYSEIAEALGVGRTAVHRHVHALVDLGYLEHTPGEQRSLRVIKHTDIDTAFNAMVAQWGWDEVYDFASRFVCRGEPA